MYFTSNPDYWKLTKPDQLNRYLISHYPLSFRDRLSQQHYRHFDADGLPMFPSRTGELVHFCTGMCSFAFAHWEEYLNTNEQQHANHVVKVADYLIQMGELRDNGALMILDYDTDLRDNGRACAMNQGESISVLSRAYCLTGTEKYKTAALDMAIPFSFDYGDKGVTGVLPETNAVWYLEGGKMILNGHIYSLFGLSDLYKITGDEKVNELLETGIKSVAESIHLYDNGYWSLYWLNKPYYVASAMYHNLHICQLRALSKMSTDPQVFLFYADRFADYAAKAINRYRSAWMIGVGKVAKRIQFKNDLN